MSQYRTGTITVSNESATVTGSGTAFLSNVSIGDDIVVRDSALTPNQIVSYIVGGVVSDTVLTLTAPYGGPSATGIPYVAHRDYLANGNPKWANGDVEFAAIQNRHNAETLPVSDFGSAAFSDTGTAPSEIPLNSDLGTAATKDVGTDIGNVMGVGAFGIGGTAVYPDDIDDPDEPTQFYVAPANHLGIVGAHWGLHISHQSDGYATQMEWRYNKFLFRNAEDGVWSDPYDVHHTGNIRTTTGQSTEYPMTQKAVTDALSTKANTSSLGSAATAEAATQAGTPLSLTPDGSIIEYIPDTGNGEAWLLAGGGKIARAKLNLSESLGVLATGWTYPVTFDMPPQIVVVPPIGTEAWSAGATERSKVSFAAPLYPSASSATIRIEAIVGSSFGAGSTVAGVSVIAIGR